MGSMMEKSADYIDVSTIDVERGEWRHTVARHVRDTVRRFGEQRFNARHVYGVICKIPRFSQQEKLYTAVKAALRYMVLKKKLEIVTQGKFTKDSPTIYRNVYIKDTEKESGV